MIYQVEQQAGECSKLAFAPAEKEMPALRPGVRFRPEEEYQDAVNFPDTCGLPSDDP